MKKIAGYARLMRPVNCLMMGFAVIVGAILAEPNIQTDSLLKLAYGFLTGFMLTAASMTINDYYDREIDAVNEPKRPIPSGSVKPKEALAVAFILTIVGFTAAFLTSLFCLVLAVIAWIIFVTYTTIGKRSGLPGNFLVSACVAMPFIYGSATIADVVMLNTWLFVAMVFLSNTGREVTKGIVDVKGDEMRNVKTVAVRYGERIAAITATFFYLFAVSLSPIPWILGIVSFWFLPAVAVADTGFIFSSIMLLKDYSRENARKIKNSVLLWFVIGLLAFLLGALK